MTTNVDITWDEYAAILRTDRVAFNEKVFHTVSPGSLYLPNWHMEAITHVLEGCLSGEIRRLIITLPPRSGKSICVSVALPALLLGLDPTQRTICVSYGQDLASKHHNDTRQVMESDWYRALFPKTRLRKSTETELTTTQGGSRFATSVGGVLTGRGGNFIIIDDPHKATDAFSDVQREAVIDWSTNTLMSRLDDKQTGRIILTQQRTHYMDLAGVWLDSGGWVHLNLPAIAERDESIAIGGDRYHIRRAGDVLHAEREPKEVLDQLRLDMGSYAYEAQYQQRPSPLGGGLIQLKWFRRYEDEPTPRPGDFVVLSCDSAYTKSDTADYTVITVWLVRNWPKSMQFALLDVFRQKLEFPDVEKAILLLQRKWDAAVVLVEKTGAGVALWQSLMRKLCGKVTSANPRDDKATRMMAETPAIERGDVWLPKEAPWLDAFEDELVSFPNGRHDDQVDSLWLFLHCARYGFRGAAVEPRRH